MVFVPLLKTVVFIVPVIMGKENAIVMVVMLGKFVCVTVKRLFLVNVIVVIINMVIVAMAFALEMIWAVRPIIAAIVVLILARVMVLVMRLPVLVIPAILML